VSKQCERPSCKEIAIAAYFLDSAELMMTLENYVPVDGMQVNGLCRRHADALVVPRGWRIEDKRENVPRLFPVTPPAEKPTDATEIVKPTMYFNNLFINNDLFHNLYLSSTIISHNCLIAFNKTS
jgi:hypothetical protein